MTRRRILAAIVLIIVMLIASPGSTALAGDEPLSLDKSSVSNGQKDVPLNARIELLFTNNVVNESVAKNNVGCIKLYQGDQEVLIDVTMADDQVEPDKKRIITVAPKQTLQEGKQYKLVIGKNVTSKNGNSIGSDITIIFSTKGAISYTWIIIGGAALICVAALWVIIKRRHENKLQK